MNTEGVIHSEFNMNQSDDEMTTEKFEEQIPPRDLETCFGIFQEDSIHV